MNLTKEQDLVFKRVKDNLKTNNIRITKIRQEIIKVIISHEHSTISDIILQLEKNNNKTNIMSVYNTLDMLLENHILYSNTFNGKDICYEIRIDQSYHLKCDICLRVLHVEEFGEFFQDFMKISNKYGWTCNHFKIEIHGVCDKCFANQGSFSEVI